MPNKESFIQNDNQTSSEINKWVLIIFSVLMGLSLLTPFWVFSEMQFPYITSKAFFFRICIELALPFYIYLVTIDNRLRPRLKNPLNFVVLLFFLVNIVTAFLGLNPSRSLWGNFERMGGVYYLAHLVCLFFYVQMLGQAGGGYLKRFLQILVASAVLVTLNGLSGLVGGPKITDDPSLPTRVSSTFGNPIFFSSFLIIPMFLSAYFALQEENRIWRGVYWVATAIQLLGIYFSGTRGAFVGVLIGLFVGAVVYVFFTKSPRLRRLGSVSILIFLCLAGAIFIFHDKLAPGSTLYRLANLRDSNTEARLIQWKVALEGYKERPFLGTGPENYYVISNKYFNPEIYKYDASWFDKPHNFLLEVLTTTGAVGFAAYLGMFILALYALWRAYKADLLSLSETCLLVSAFMVYQIQNLFVFDTVSASVVFYGFLGMVAYLWTATGAESKRIKSRFDKTLILGIGATLLLGSFYLVYVSNVISMEAAKRVNFGYVYTEYSAKKAADYFELALSLSPNLDLRETANRYSDFAVKLVTLDSQSLSPEFIKEQIDKATANQRMITEETKNDPLLWWRLAIDEMTQAGLANKDVNVARASIDRAVSLAPKRVDLLQTYLQLDGYTKNWSDASQVAEKIVSLNPYNPELRWQLAMAKYLSGDIKSAAVAGDEAVAQGYKFTKLQQFAWYIQYYKTEKNDKKVAELLEIAIEIEPNELGLYFELAEAYARLGDKEHARLLAEKIMTIDQTKKAEMERFIQSLRR